MNQVATTPQRRFLDLIQTEKYQKGLADACPKGVTPERIQKIVISAMNKNPDLLQCTELSMYNACIDCATLDLWPGPQGHIYLIKRNAKVKEAGGVRYEEQASAMIGWRGMIELAYRSGAIVPGSFIGQAIHENDHFEHEYGSNQRIIHRPKMGARGKPIGVWVGCVPKDGALVFHVMDTVEIETVRARSQSPDVGPWVTDWIEMGCKTALRRMWKYLPSSVADKYADILERDAEREFDLKHVQGEARPAVRTDSRLFSDDIAPAEKTAAKQALDTATEQVEQQEQREQQAAPVEGKPITVGMCSLLAKELSGEVVGGIYESFDAHSLSELNPNDLPAVHAALLKEKAKVKA